jgi:hypothetical protein
MTDLWLLEYTIAEWALMRLDAIGSASRTDVLEGFALSLPIDIQDRILDEYGNKTSPGAHNRMADSIYKARQAELGVA